MLSKVPQDLITTITSIFSSAVGAIIYKLYKNEKGEKFNLWAWIRHIVIAGAIGGFVYPLLPEGRMSAALLSIIGALSIQIMKIIDDDGLNILMKLLHITKKEPK